MEGGVVGSRERGWWWEGRVFMWLKSSHVLISLME